MFIRWGVLNVGRKAIDETGNHYGRLTVLERFEDAKGSAAEWVCQCDCGEFLAVRGTKLRSGGVRSCGCLKRELTSKRCTIDLTGQKFGRLTVVKRQGSDKQAKATWLCRCNCGNEKVIAGYRLRRGNVRSCGCLRKLLKGEAAFNKMFRNMQRNAKTRRLEWHLTREQVRRLTKQLCFYCGAEPAQVWSEKTLDGAYTYNGIDRVNNERGYTTDNVVPCCGRCNSMKRTMTSEEFKSQIITIYQHFASAETSSLHLLPETGGN